MTKEFGTLYKKSKSTGKVQEWTITVTGTTNKASIVKIHGGVGEKLTVDKEDVTKGKNIGRSNETTPWEQAVADATSDYEKKLKTGYVKTKAAAQRGETDKIIKGGVEAQLAHKHRDHAHKIIFPCAGQPKLDGIRCLAIKKGDDVTLWSRTRKQIISVPHVIEDIKKHFKNVDVILDGELYNHAYKYEFEKITEIVGQKKEPHVDHKLVEYHIYDVVSDKSFDYRFLPIVEKMFGNDFGSLKVVQTFLINTEHELFNQFQICLSQGYEGMMARNLKPGYEHKRSYNLQKVKEFDDAEFDIVNVIAGKQDTVIFVCKTAAGTEFEATMSGDRASNQQYLERPTLWRGKRLTVQYQGFTGANNVPRFPIGKAVRDYE